MKKIRINQSKLTNYNYLSHKLIKVRNRRNVLIDTNLIFSNQRKDQGLFIAHLNQPKNDYYVLLASLKESLRMGDFEYHLSVSRKGDQFKTSGLKYLYKVVASPYPKLFYRLGTINLVKSFVLDPKNNFLFVRYFLMEAPVKINFEISPLLAFRELNQLSFANDRAEANWSTIESGYGISMYPEFEPIYFMSDKNMNDEILPYWIRGFRYPIENSKCEVEDLFVPGNIHFSLKQGEDFLLVIGLEPILKHNIETEFEAVKSGLLTLN